MVAHTYGLRSRLNSPSISVKTPATSPLPKGSVRSPRKPSCYPSALQLKHIIGSTVSNPSGLTTCEALNSFAYCAGSVAVLATIDGNGSIAYRYFKARPTTIALNSTPSYFDSVSASNTPTRKSVFVPRKGRDDVQGTGSGREWLEESGGLTWTARERIKAATCVSISPDGRLLAVGETGYNPRVLLFSTATHTSTEQPLSIMTEHTVGVRSIAFSPDSRYLATLGDVNDGFLYIWAINTKTGDAKLHSTNKCTTNVCDMTWCGNNVITVGTRHIKVWHVATAGRLSPSKRPRLRLESDNIPSPGPTPLQGRNCLLGKMVDATFTAITPVSSDIAVVCADDGQMCKLDLSEGKAELIPVDVADCPVGAISFRKNVQRVVWAGGGNILQEHDINCWSQTESIESPALTREEGTTRRKRISRHSLLRESLGLTQPKRAAVVALGCLNTSVVSVDADGGLRIVPLDDKLRESDAHRLSSHQDLVKGIRTIPSDANLGSFYTWARNGEVRFWSIEGDLLRTESCDLDQVTDDDESGTNELIVVHYFASRSEFVLGDRYGVLKVFEKSTWVSRSEVRAHSAEITGLAAYEPDSLLATCGRDRMVQLFSVQEHNMELVQTMDEHISAVQHVCFSNDGQRLLSCSTDRTIIVRERMERGVGDDKIVAYLSAKVITMKSSPLSMALRHQEQDVLVVSTMDRHVVKVDVATGSILETFKVADKDTDDTSILNTICLSTVHDHDEHPIVIGYSSIDKSIRAYDLQKGNLLGRESGHTEGISDIILIETPSDGINPIQRTIVSTGLDSTIMLWSIAPASQPLLTPLHELSQSQAGLHDADNTPAKASPATLPPLRKILSKMDIAGFVRHSSPSRDASPHRLRRKGSRLALTTSIEEADEDQLAEASRARSRGRAAPPEKRSPSPPVPLARPKKQRSITEIGRIADSKRTDWIRRSPSPPSMPISTPTTPKYQRANNGRLRRPPSVPTDLRGQAAAQQRRQSMSNASDFGSIGMASEQACRMLRTYRKKLQSSRGELDLDDVERELEMALSVVRHKRNRSSVGEQDILRRPSGGVEHEVAELTVLLEQTAV